MLRSIGTAAAFALAASGPAVAGDKGQGHGPGGPAHAMKDHGRESSGEHRGADKDTRSERARGDRAFPAAAQSADRGWKAGERESRGDARRGDDDRSGWASVSRRRSERDDRAYATDERFAAVGACPPGLARKHNGCLPPGLARQQAGDWGYRDGPAFFGVPVRGDARYVYYDGYLIPATSGAGYIPLLGGALAVGQLWPDRYPSAAIADWQGRYFGFDEPGYYRYADNVIYRVDPQTSAIETVAALLTGSDFTVGAPLPAGYDIYNVPGPFQSRYRDSDAALYRYADGRIYQVDPATMLIAKAIDLVL